ncbi:regulatory protein YycI of two-component signal transduction system YycFG [Lactobacillus colini]|uniref:Regulatory protein YycI of two-component signal transduction system YycFG n=1 Tax=Lactobacillus colini TaxID=1819254 RepID=A0ABS4MCT4_9LACO|nr:two-component system regulatory protein YycI [Lactobacillus colini]MBP2057495.1 regulatory protein YycI of two-component signal transduction system YycFG [Lactobacillus colini]
MDFKRIQWIFLIVFIGINIFLGIEVIQTPTLLSSNATTNTGDNLQQEMIADNIKIPHLSDKQSDGYYLASKINKKWVNKAQSQVSGEVSINSPSDGEDSISVSLTTPVAVSSNKKQAIEDIISFKDNPKNVYEGDQYVYSPEYSSDNDYVFLQKTSYGVIYSRRSRLHIMVRNNKIVSYYQRYTDTVTTVRERQTTISAKEAINSLYTYSELPNNSKVIWMKLGYAKLTQVRGNVIFLPAWIVAIENDTSKTVTIKRVNAFTSTILQSQTNSSDKSDEEKS